MNISKKIMGSFYPSYSTSDSYQSESDYENQSKIDLQRENKNEVCKWNNIIDAVNNLQSYSRKYNKSSINFPEIVVIGSQSSGKSSILERIIDCDILPKDKNTCTKCPIILQLSPLASKDEIKAEFVNEKNLQIKGEINIRKKIEEITKRLEGFSKIPIIIKLKGKGFPQLTLVDLPGLIKNSPTGNDNDVDYVRALTEMYIESKNSIILAVSAANVDLANSDSIQMSRNFDSEGTRTFHVITKIDLMDKGTDAIDILNNDLLSKSLGVILLKNRSQQSLSNNESNASVRESEQKFLVINYKEIADQHGIDILVSKLVNIFNNEIKTFLPKIREDLENSIKERESKLKKFYQSADVTSLKQYINKFIKMYDEIINGNKNSYRNELEGGSLISEKIYDNFEKIINDLKIDNINAQDLGILMRNTAGIMKASYSPEKAYLYLSKKQIKKFDVPIEETLKEVKSLLKEFVKEAINEANISQYFQLILFLTDKMQIFLEESFEHTSKIIKDLIKSEKHNVLCEYPINEPLQLSNNKSDEFKKEYLKNDINKSDENTKQMIKMLDDHFKASQQNIICNFPKWIQKFMVKDLLKSMKQLEFETNLDASYLLRLDEEYENRFKILKDELKEFQNIRNQLNESIKNL